MVGNEGGGSQTENRKCEALPFPYTDAWRPESRAQQQREGCAVVQTRIKPYYQQVAEKTQREEQRRIFRRNQAIGLVMVAGVILLWWIFHTNPKWIFPQGWWRL
jgi:hypothetical protein